MTAATTTTACTETTAARWRQTVIHHPAAALTKTRVVFSIRGRTYACSSMDEEVDPFDEVIGVDAADDGGLARGGSSSCCPQPQGHECREK